jgi:glycosyltransferase involved in cell wall biosynthesis
MKFSVITVCWNAAGTIGDTLASVAAQLGPEVEHIIIDGGSTDGTLEIVERHKRVGAKVFSAPDNGIYDAMNKGLDFATGDVIGFLNADDFYCRTDALAAIEGALQEAPDCHGVAAAIAIVNPEAPERVLRHYPSRGFQRWMIRFGHMVSHPGLYVRSSAVRTVGAFDTRFRISGDFDWLSRFLFRHSLRLQTIDMTVVGMREGGASTSGFASKRLLNREITVSLRANHIPSHPMLVWSKYVLKLLQLIRRAPDYPAPSDVRWPSSTSDQAPL